MPSKLLRATSAWSASTAMTAATATGVRIQAAIPGVLAASLIRPTPAAAPSRTTGRATPTSRITGSARPKANSKMPARMGVIHAA